MGNMMKRKMVKWMTMEDQLLKIQASFSTNFHHGDPIRVIKVATIKKHKLLS